MFQLIFDAIDKRYNEDLLLFESKKLLAQNDDEEVEVLIRENTLIQTHIDIMKELIEIKKKYFV